MPGSQHRRAAQAAFLTVIAVLTVWLLGAASAAAGVLE
ncbi:MAG: hypothetical protein JWO14_328, partial [Solirubrobacterales bacterium]|nr:hypothetical protein [Solirubrobacterales bacterium]